MEVRECIWLVTILVRLDGSQMGLGSLRGGPRRCARFLAQATDNPVTACMFAPRLCSADHRFLTMSWSGRHSAFGEVMSFSETVVTSATTSQCRRSTQRYRVTSRCDSLPSTERAYSWLLPARGSAHGVSPINSYSHAVDGYGVVVLYLSMERKGVHFAILDGTYHRVVSALSLGGGGFLRLQRRADLLRRTRGRRARRGCRLLR